MDKSKVAVRMFNGLPEMTWSSVTSTGFKDEICMTTLASGEQKINLQNTLANKKNFVDNEISTWHDVVVIVIVIVLVPGHNYSIW